MIHSEHQGVGKPVFIAGLNKMKTKRPITRYKFLREGMKSEKGNQKWRVGKWYKVDGELSMCNQGFHCSKEPYDAFSYVRGEILSKVEVRGTHLSEENKECWSEMKVIKAYKWTKKDSVKLAIFSAEQVIKFYEEKYPNDDRPRKAIKAAKEWLKNPSKKSRAAAYDAAAAANAAAYATNAYAAYDAAAAYAAAAADAAAAAVYATAAADAAAYATNAYARKRMMDKIKKYFLKLVKNLKSV